MSDLNMVFYRDSTLHASTPHDVGVNPATLLIISCDVVDIRLWLLYNKQSIILLQVHVVWYTVDVGIPKTVYARSTGEGRCSCGGHRAPTTRDFQPVAVVNAVLQRPSKYRNPPTGTDQLRPTARGVPRTCLPLPVGVYQSIIILLLSSSIFFFLHHYKNAGTLYSYMQYGQCVECIIIIVVVILLPYDLYDENIVITNNKQ